MPTTGQEIESDRTITGLVRPGRRAKLAMVVLALVGVVIAGLLVSGIYGDRRRPELSDLQWQRLVDEFSRVAASDAEPPAGRGSSSVGRRGAQGPATEPSAPSTGSAGSPRAPSGASRPRPGPRPAVDAGTLAAQAVDYAADRAKSIIELQRFRHTASIEIRGGDDRRGTARLINLNPRINAWYLLEVSWDGQPGTTYHLASSEPERQTLILDPAFTAGLVIDDGVAPVRCDLWSPDAPRPLASATEIDSPYVLLCDGRVTLRLPTAGRKTRMERVTDFLRDNVWAGERITVFVRQTLFQDSHLEVPETTATDAALPGSVRVSDSPRPARIDAESQERLVTTTGLGLSVANPGPRGPDVEDPGVGARDAEGSGGQGMSVGRWYRVRGNRGIWASAMLPGLVDRDILASHSDRVARLDEVEEEALTYLVAFDLERFELGFAMGTDHPRVGWSDRVGAERRAPDLPGPDGIDTIAPLVSTGIIPPAVAPRTVATFTAGFKRTHGAFRHGDLATANHGSHYGFVEHGVVLSKLQPGLSTLYVLDDGRVDMKTWTVADDELLERVRFARQNGVPIVEYDAAGGTGVPGPLVNRWGPGNWSGSQDGRYRTLRAGACLQENDARRFLVYGYFSSATPGAMARVFQSYGCRHAMLLDMNALEHTYLAVYWLQGSELGVQHLIEGMSVLDRSEEGRLLPRFLGYADNRDFFYLVRREATTATRQEIEP